MLEGIIQGKALADLFLIEAFINNGAMVAGDLRGIVGAVVRDNNRVEHFRRVILLFDGVDKLADDGRFIARRNNCRKPVQRHRRLGMLFGFALLPPLPDEDDDNIKHLIDI